MAGEKAFKWHPLWVAAVVAVLGGLLFLLWPASQVFLVIFASVLFAVLIDGLAMLLTGRLAVPQTIARSVVIFLMLALFVTFMMLAGPRFADQMTQLAERLPEALDQLDEVIREQPWGDMVRNVDLAERLRPSASDILNGVTGVFSTAFEALANVVVVFFIGLYLALQPDVYVRGFLHLVPKDQRQRWNDILEALGHALRWWLVGRFAAMAAVGVLTTLGLWLIDMPLALVLGVIAGLLSFVPYVGPIASVVPAMLIGLMETPWMAAYVVGVYVLVQFIEGNFITPLIQKRVVSLPPAVLLSAQFSLGIFYGLFGVLLATPLAVTGIVLIQMLYVQDVLRDPVKVLGEDTRLGSWHQS